MLRVAFLLPSLRVPTVAGAVILGLCSGTALPGAAQAQNRAWVTETTRMHADPRSRAPVVARIGRCERVALVPGGPLSLRWARVRTQRHHGYVAADHLSRDRPEDCGPTIARPEGRVRPQAEAVIPRSSAELPAVTTLRPRPDETLRPRPDVSERPPREPDEEERPADGPYWGP